MTRALGMCVLMICATVAMASPLQDDQTRYVVKTSSKIEFHSTSTFAKVVGVFHSWEANMKMPADRFADASLVLEIDAASAATGSGLRDKELKGKNFFAVQEHPKIRFASKKISADSAPAKFHMDGELTIRGITQPVSVSITFLRQDDGHEWIDGSFSFNRRDFGMTHNLPFDKIANTVLVQFHLDTVNGTAPGGAELKRQHANHANYTNREAIDKHSAKHPQYLNAILRKSRDSDQVRAIKTHAQAKGLPSAAGFQPDNSLDSLSL